MDEKIIIKNCCLNCAEKDINCLGCIIGSGHPQAPQFQDFCKECIEKKECVIKFNNMKDRNVCWVLSDEDRDSFRKENPDYDAKLKEQEKKAEEEEADKITDEDIARMERMIALKKKKMSEKGDKHE